ncbi:MAG TPA: polysaccharide deacetylase, partial [Paracoccus solventivorans]|nr:polysaccharide deacetylase [Paracoccus solventivorans]
MTGARHLGQALAVAGAAAAAGLATLAAALAASPVLALGVPLALIGAVVLLAQPFLGIAALVFLGHLDSIEKLLFGFLPLSGFKALTAATLAAALLTAARRRDWIAGALRDP